MYIPNENLRFIDLKGTVIIEVFFFEKTSIILGIGIIICVPLCDRYICNR
jgi:hypothetical protein